MMNTISFEQTSAHLLRQVRRWDVRLRMALSLLWGPRGLILGVLVGIAVALFARTRPWLLPEEIAGITLGVTVLGGLGVLTVIWLWPRSPERNARHFDRRFDLKERVSTALELSSGTIPLPDRLAERQLSDAVHSARRVDPKVWLPLRVRFWEIAILGMLVAFLAYLLITDNPQVEELRARRELEDAVDAQTAALEQAIEDVQANDALTEEEQDALTAVLEEARDNLEESDESLAEAMAAMVDAEQQLDQLTSGMMQDHWEAYQQAARALADSELTADLARSLQRGDLEAAARAMDKLAEKLARSEMSEEQRNDLADQLEQAAEALREQNPELAEKLQEAADALRRGDMEAAQQALEDAAETLREQKQQLENSELATEARAVKQQIQQGRQELAQVGQPQDQPMPEGDMVFEEGEPGQMGDAQPGEEAGPGEGEAADASQAQPGEGEQSPSGAAPGEEGQPGEPSGAAAAGDTASGEQATTGTEQGEGEPDSLSPSGEAGEGEANTAFSGNDQAGEVNQPSAGEGEGGVGVDNVEGREADQGGLPSTNAEGSAEDGIGAAELAAESVTMGGEEGESMALETEAGDPEGAPVREVENEQRDEGESVLVGPGTSSAFQDVVNQALSSSRIPLAQRDVIHDYFEYIASLEQEQP